MPSGDGHFQPLPGWRPPVLHSDRALSRRPAQLVLDSRQSDEYHQRNEASVRNEFTAVIEQDGDWFIAYCPEVPGANGQGRTREEARSSLAAAISLILEDRREEGLRGVPDDAVRETVVVE